MRWYRIQVGSQTWDATGDPNALNVEMDISVGPNHAPANPNAAWCRVWGIPLQTVLTANKFNNQTIQVYGGMQQGLPLANPSERGLLVQGTIFPCLGNWINTDMTLDFYIKAIQGTPSVPGAANITHNWPAGQQLSTAVQSALQTAFPGFTTNIKISPNLIRPNDEWGFYQTIGQYATFLFNASKDIIKTKGYQGIQVSIQGKTINVTDGTQGQSSGPTINPQDLVGQPVWTDVNKIQFKTVMRGDLNIQQTVTLPKSLATLTSGNNTALPGNPNQTNLIQGSFIIQSIRHVGNFRQPSWSDWCTVVDAIQSNIGGSSGTSTPLGQGGIGHQ